VLAAERAAYEALREAARHAVAGLRDESEYEFVCRRLSLTLRDLLGDEAQLQEAAGGGLIATARGRSADLSFARLADRAVDTVLAEESGEPPDSSAPRGPERAASAGVGR
jgi:hypothetical protein